MKSGLDGGDSDPHDEIVRLEEHIEKLAARIENCRKFILASRVAIACSGLRARRPARRRNPVRSRRNGWSGCSISRGHCRVGFKRQHRKEAAKELATAEADRAALIEMIDLTRDPIVARTRRRSGASGSGDQQLGPLASSSERPGHPLRAAR